MLLSSWHPLRWRRLGWCRSAWLRKGLRRLGLVAQIPAGKIVGTEIDIFQIPFLIAKRGIELLPRETSRRGVRKTRTLSAQLYSTASYKVKELQGIHLTHNDLTGWDFAGHNLANAAFDYSTLTDVDFANANVAGASFSGAHGFTKEQLYSTASYSARALDGWGLRLGCQKFDIDTVFGGDDFIPLQLWISSLFPPRMRDGQST